MSACPSCGAEPPDGARFCPSCGALLADRPAVSTERKLVTTLFADIVGFTSLNERFDPEDVDAALRAYFTMARETIVRFGGVVEKYIGDAVAGVFGAPLAHEDDPERAVRAALAITDGMASLPRIGGQPLLVRVGVNTGRSLVRLGVNPALGEGMQVGDAVNTTARLLAAAAPMSVVVGDATHALSARAIDYEELPPFAVKGKSQPVKAWLARSTAARRGADFDRTTATPMVGREVELGVLNGLFDKALASSTPQYALVIGEAGIGKSRLLHEFGRQLDRRPDLMCTWRQGSSPAYGDGLAYWALGEIVAAHAGILQSDEPSVVESKLVRALGGEGRDEWLVSRVRPLVGLPSPPADREESFAAWLRFLLGLARERPTVLVFEDVHWASEATLAFLGYAVRHASHAPLLAIATARPEFGEAHARLAGFEAVHSIELKCLDADESARLVAELPGADSVPGIRELAVARCGGNPLFTEELARYMVERHASAAGEDGPSTDAEVPDSLHTMIGARLDALPPAQKAALSDAAVVGQVFWPGTLAAMNAPDATVARTLEQLERRELIRARSSTSIESEREFAFWHMLIRDVAYEQLPRATRAAKHAAVARWIDVSGARGAGLAEVRAYHYATAHQLACAIRDDDLAADLREPAMTAHKQAGDEALSTDVTVAERHYARACALTLPDDAIRPHLTVALAEAQIEEGRLADAVDQLLQGISALKAAGDRRAAAVAMTRLSTTMYWQDSDHSARARELRAEALDMLAHDGPSEARVTVLEECAVQSTRDYINEEAVRFADLAIAMNRALGLPERVRSIAYRGTSLCCLGNDAGLAELRRAWELAMSRGEALEADAACQLLAELTYAFEGPDAALALARRGYEYAARRGGRLTPLWFRQQLVEFGRLRGEWMESLADAIELGSIVDESDRMDIAESRLEIALVRVHQGDCPEAARLLDLVPDEGGRQQWLMTEVATLRAALQAQTGDLAGARESLRRLEPSIRDHSLVAFSAANLPLIVRLAFEAGVPELIVPLVRPPGTPRAIDLCTTIMAGGLTAEHEGRLEDAERTLAEAAKAWSAFGNPWEAALALRDRGRCLLALGRASEAVAALSEARDVFRRLGARPALADAEALLARATEGSGSPTPGGTAPTRPAQASRDSGTRPAT